MDSCEPRMVLRNIPVMNFVLGFLFAAAGTFGLYEGGPLILLLFAGIGLALLLFTSVVTVTVEKINRTLTLKRRSVFFRSRTALSFEEIIGISIQPVRGSKNRVFYQLVAKHRDGKIMPLGLQTAYDARSREPVAARLRDFLGVPAFDSSPAGVAYARLDSYMNRIQETDGVHWQILPAGSGRWISSDFRTSGFFLCLAQKAEGQASDGILASLGAMIFKKLLSGQFTPEDIPGIEQASIMGPLDPAIEQHFMAFSNFPDAARNLFNPAMVTTLADWAGRHPIKQFHKLEGSGQLSAMFCPRGIYIFTSDFLQPDQVPEITALGTSLVRSQIRLLN
jgi:hypothetical protein